MHARTHLHTHTYKYMPPHNTHTTHRMLLRLDLGNKYSRAKFSMYTGLIVDCDGDESNSFHDIFISANSHILRWKVSFSQGEETFVVQRSRWQTCCREALVFSFSRMLIRSLRISNKTLILSASTFGHLNGGVDFCACECAVRIRFCV
jgi:hypothetical protein